jgi:hypothetical protein
MCGRAGGNVRSSGREGAVVLDVGASAASEPPAPVIPPSHALGLSSRTRDSRRPTDGSKEETADR